MNIKRVKSRLQYRMYFFVLYNISPIQQGIQAGHAALEYARKFGDDKSFKDFAFWDKTWIILNGGTSNDSHLGNPIGSMEEMYELLRNEGIKIGFFHEPDLNDSLTAICFLADERVWDYEKYPMFKDFLLFDDIADSVDVSTNMFLKTRSTEDLIKLYPNSHHAWLTMIGGKKNKFLKELLIGRKLA